MIPLPGVSAALVVPILLSPPMRVALHTEYSIFRQLEHSLIFTLSMLSRRLKLPWVTCCSHQLIPSSFLCISQNTPPFPLIQDTPFQKTFPTARYPLLQELSQEFIGQNLAPGNSFIQVLQLHFMFVMKSLQFPFDTVFRLNRPDILRSINFHFLLVTFNKIDARMKDVFDLVFIA